MPHELCKNQVGEINPYSMLSILKFLATVWRRVTPVSDFQATLGYEYPHRLRRNLRSIWRLFVSTLFQTNCAEPEGRNDAG